MSDKNYPQHHQQPPQPQVRLTSPVRGGGTDASRQYGGYYQNQPPPPQASTFNFLCSKSLIVWGPSRDTTSSVGPSPPIDAAHPTHVPPQSLLLTRRQYTSSLISNSPRTAQDAWPGTLSRVSLDGIDDDLVPPQFDRLCGSVLPRSVSLLVCCVHCCNALNATAPEVETGTVCSKGGVNSPRLSLHPNHPLP
jgi:hypothetical protein